MSTENAKFWANRYANATDSSSGEPSRVLAKHAAARTPGDALDLGCSRGDDSVWLARHGWRVLGVDISEAVIDIARANATRNNQEQNATFEVHDLELTFPEGQFDLVSAMFFQSMVPFPRHAILHRAALSVRPGGLLLIATHASVPPWRTPPEHHVLLSPDEELAELELDTADWDELFVGSLSRSVSGPGDQTAEVVDNVIALERREPHT